MPLFGSAAGSVGGGGSTCAGWSGEVPANDRHVLRQPVVTPVFWGHFYATTPDAVSETTRLLSDLAGGRFMDGARQYGVSKGSVDSPVVVDVVAPDREPTTLSDTDILVQLQDWLDKGTVAPPPAAREKNRLFFIFPPTTADLTWSKDQSFEGYHEYAWSPQPKKGTDPGPYNLFWAVVRTKSASTETSSGLEFARSRAYIVSHELIEAATDRDGQGFTTPSCEIGDICEAVGQTACCSTYDYLGWQAEYYWSNWDNRCIRGDEPLSLRRLAAILVVQFQRVFRALGT